MIAKERNPQEHPEKDRFSLAGAKAEEQMAHYLRRAFVDNPDIAVFNDLRIVDEAGEAAQFDHLLLHRRGFIVIESKSVTSAVRINEAGEWTREWDGRWSGMPSPVRQAERQIDLVKKVLSAHRDQLRGKLLLGKLQKGFGVTPFEILIAISDKVRIDRDPHTPQEVHKAESIVTKVKETIAKHRMGFFSKGEDKGLEKFTDKEFAAILDFLVQRHTPLHVPADSASKPSRIPATASTSQATSAGEISTSYSTHATQASATTPQPSTVAPLQTTSTPATVQQACPKCQATGLSILYGRFGYYWKCSACNHTNDIERTCPQCGEKTKTRKEGSRFHRDCPKCGTSVHFHTNAEQA